MSSTKVRAAASSATESEPDVSNDEANVEIAIEKKGSVKGKSTKVSSKKAKKGQASKADHIEEGENDVHMENDENEDETEKVAPKGRGKGAKKEEMPVKKGKKAEAAGGDSATEEDNLPEDVAEVKANGKKSSGRGKGRKQAAQVEDDSEDADVPDVKTAKSSSGTRKGKKTAVAAVEDEPETKKAKNDASETKRGGRGKKAVEEEQESDDKDVEMKEEDEVPAKKPTRGGSRNGREKKENDEEVEQPKTTKKASSRGRKSAKEEETGVGEKNEEMEEEKEGEKTTKKPTRGGSRNAQKNYEEEQEEKPVAKGKGRAKKEEKKADDEQVAKSNDRPKRAAAKRGDDARKAGEGTSDAKNSDTKEESDDESTKPRRGKGKAASGKGKKGAKTEDREPAGSIKNEGEEDDEGGKSGSSAGKSIRRNVVVKGKAAVDPSCTRKVDTCHVFVDGELIYDVMLNQTNIGNNNNKFYIIQLLEDDEKNEYSVWFRWGRVGYEGQNKLVECGGNLAKAKMEFANKFKAKTVNDWPVSFDDFEPHAYKYTMIEMDYGGEATESCVKMEVEQEEEEKKCKVVSKLDARVQHLIHLICSIRTMTQTVKELEYDAEKSPLGKLTPHQIKEGYSCLKKIEEFINKKSFGFEWKAANNEYYTKIPHACGFRPPELIKTPQKLKTEIELLDLLSDIEYALKTMKQETVDEKEHPIDRHYASLHCTLNPLDVTDNEYTLVGEYLKNTHGTTHSIRMTPKNVFLVEREGEEEHDEVMKNIGNRMLLWHGSRLSNMFGILSQGLRIAPPEAPMTGYMFGKGVYFADMSTKSGNYCYASEDGQTAFLVLAEVALGEPNKLTQAKYDANKLPKGKNSTWGLGRTQPDPTATKKLPDDCLVPCGTPVSNPEGKDSALLYNEYIVYDTNQIKIRYLVEVEFNFA